jgi:uncharacterized protein YjcR
MPEETKRKGGAPKGNQNARKHGFYSRVLDEQERRDYECAISVEGLDEEIALLRVKIRSLVERDPENLRLIMQAVNALARLVMTRYDIRKDDMQSLKEKVGNVLRNVVLPLGINVGANFIK